MGRLPSGVLLVMSLSWSGMATEDCRSMKALQGVYNAIDQCRYKLDDRTHQLPTLHLGHKNHFIEGSFHTNHADGIQIAQRGVQPGFCLSPPTTITMDLSFYWQPYNYVPVSVSFNLVPSNSNDDSGRVNTSFRFSISLEKTSHWQVTVNQTLVRPTSEPEATIKLNDHGSLDKSFKNGKVNGYPGTDMANIIRQFWFDKINSMLREMYDGWLENCVFPTLLKAATD